MLKAPEPLKPAPLIPTLKCIFIFNLWRNLWKSCYRQAFAVPKETQGVIYPAQMNGHSGKGKKKCFVRSVAFELSWKASVVSNDGVNRSDIRFAWLTTHSSWKKDNFFARGHVFFFFFRRFAADQIFFPVKLINSLLFCESKRCKVSHLNSRLYTLNHVNNLGN